MSTFSFDDSVNAEALPTTQDIGLYYADGRYANESAVRARLPHAKLFGITVTGAKDVKIAACDCETGDLTPTQAIEWVEWQIANNSELIIVYANASTWSEGLYSALSKYGSRIKRWIAAYPGTGDDVPEGFDAHQWSGNVPGENGGIVDKNIALENFLTPWHLDYSIYIPENDINGVVYHERADVEAYDKLRKDTDKGAEFEELKTKMKTMADIIWERAHTEALAKTGKTQWLVYHRGSRYQGLIKRAAGERLV